MMQMYKDLKYITFIPLIGGMAIANYQATGRKPEFVLSYEPFQKNEAHLKKYWDDVEWHLLDPETNTTDEELDYSDIDFVSSVCPCAGLSSMNMNHSQDSSTNDWMYKAAEYILGTIKPKVYFGENAPGLYSDTNKKVSDRLYEYAKQYGYSFTIYKTNTELHGIPQRRIRTFYFFWKGDTCPIMNWYNHPSELPFEEWILDKNVGAHNELPVGDPIEDFAASKWIYETLCNNEYTQYVKFFNDRSTNNSRIISAYDYIVRYNKFDEYLSWLRSNPVGNQKLSLKSKHTHLSVAEYRYNKVKNGMNYYSIEPVVFTGYTSAITGKNIEITLHPKEQRYITTREIMSMMGLPTDFELVTPNIVHITQNVPVCTAKDMTEQVVKFINGALEMSEYSYLKQDNIKQRIDYKE
jgi:site-specific DNA-cytosine methylase